MRNENEMSAPGAEPRNQPPAKQGLYDPQFEHDACGVGFVVNMKGKKSHEVVQQGIQILINLDHRGACGLRLRVVSGVQDSRRAGRRHVEARAVA